MNAHPAIATLARCLKVQTIARTGIFLVVIALLTVPFFNVSSASFWDPSNKNAAADEERTRQAERRVRQVDFGVQSVLGPITKWIVQPVVLLPQGVPEEIAIYQMDCTTPATNFSLGATMCAKITGAPVDSNPQRRLVIVNPGNFVQAQADVLSSTQDLVFTLPTATTASFGDVTVDNRGTWRALSLATSDSTTRFSTPFLVRDPQNQAADLSIQSGDHDEAAGIISFGLFLTNNGPDDATNVQVTDAVPAGTTFVSASQEAGPAFNCQTPAQGGTGITTCTIASLSKGAEVKFKFIYSVVAAAGTEILHTSDVASDTDESHTPDNTTESSATVSSAGGGGAACVLDCPNNIVVSANTTQGGTSGAIVTFPGADTFGDCGTVTASPSSGSFFPVGNTTVLVTSSTGDGNCSFVVTVVEDAAPTISCPANIVTTTTGCDPATVDPLTPTASPSGVTVTGERSDGLALTDPYPAGITTILWTATDAQARSASCTQTITVNSDDSEPPTITPPADVNTSTPLDAVGSCGVVVGESQLGTAQATDNCSVNISRTGVPAGNFFPVGTTVITYTATDVAGNTATATQNVIVADGPPVIYAPADASYVCPSEVPAADPSQATGPDIIDANGNPQPGPPADSCSTVTVTVAESSTGAGSAGSPLIITRTFTATDTSGHSASAVQTITVIDAIAPAVSAPADANFECASDVPAANAADATASDNCAPPTITVADTNNGGAGSASSPLVITRTYTATDAAGNTASDSQIITVIDATAPSIVLAGPNPQVVECHTAYNELGASATDNCSGTFAATPSGNVDVNVVGSYTVTYSATDAAGNTAIATRTVDVVDTTAPTTTLTNLAIFLNNFTIVFNDDTVTVNGQTYPFNGVSFTHGGFTFLFDGSSVTINGTTYPLEGKTLVLWTPTHQYQTVKLVDLIAGASDSCDTGIDLNDAVITSVTSDEVQNAPGLGDGNTVNDIVIAADCKSVQLRAERDNNGNGRVYTITSRVTDAQGNGHTVTSQIKVRRFLQPAVDSGAQYTITGSCP
jgi:uncharacterized repeat protein (TIGR01451 family)